MLVIALSSSQLLRRKCDVINRRHESKWRQTEERKPMDSAHTCNISHSPRLLVSCFHGPMVIGLYVYIQMDQMHILLLLLLNVIICYYYFTFLLLSYTIIFRYCYYYCCYYYYYYYY